MAERRTHNLLPRIPAVAAVPRIENAGEPPGGAAVTVESAISPLDRLYAAFARASDRRIGQVLVQIFGERGHSRRDPCLYEISDDDLAAALERELDGAEARP